MNQNYIYKGPQGAVDKLGIEEVIIRRKIKRLVHFTRFENIEKICSEGLMPVRNPITGELCGISQVDGYRKDGRLNHISLSVTEPNSKIMYLKNKLEVNFPLILILLNPDLLKCHPALFFPTNAASGEYIGKKFNYLNWNYGEKFENIFPTEDKESSIPICMQAEIQVLGPICKEWIIGVCYYSNLDQEHLDKLLELKKHLKNTPFTSDD